MWKRRPMWPHRFTREAPYYGLTIKDLTFKPLKYR